MALHSLSGTEALDAAAFEREQAARIGIPANVGLRHRLPHFQHLFTGDGYAAGYYVYMWAEVLEADAWSAFEEKGDPFDPELARKLRAFIYGAGNSADPAALFRAFRGRDPSIRPLLAQRGLRTA
jgi:peptidyl-dipeptidase Dcp